jgi:manganese/zinc/iron transport system permease protein
MAIDASIWMLGEESWSQLWRLLTLQDHNTRVVLTGTTLLGVASGLTGTWMLLRRRALMGDALAHATLPGVAMAYLIMFWLGHAAKSLPMLLVGAAVTGMAGVLATLGIIKWTRLKADSALGIVLSGGFAIGIVLLGFIQGLPGADATGLTHFILGHAASMIQRDAITMAVVAVCASAMCLLLFKELQVLSFDSIFAKSQGWPTKRLDLLLTILITIVTVSGLQAVGLVLVVALLIIPAAAARFWTDRLGVMLVLSGVIGGVSGLLGTSISALAPRLPAGAIIVLVASGLFVISMLIAPTHGMITVSSRRIRHRLRVRRDHVLRAIWEAAEHLGTPPEDPIAITQVIEGRPGSSASIKKGLGASQRRGDVRIDGDSVRFTPKGLDSAGAIVRRHRLWEMFLMTHADIAPSHVDRDADEIEHVLGPGLVRELEEAVAAMGRPLPPSPHALGVSKGNTA